MAAGYFLTMNEHCENPPSAAAKKPFPMSSEIAGRQNQGDGFVYGERFTFFVLDVIHEPNRAFSNAAFLFFKVRHPDT